MVADKGLFRACCHHCYLYTCDHNVYPLMMWSACTDSLTGTAPLAALGPTSWPLCDRGWICLRSRPSDCGWCRCGELWLCCGRSGDHLQLQVQVIEFFDKGCWEQGGDGIHSSAEQPRGPLMELSSLFFLFFVFLSFWDYYFFIGWKYC